MSILAEEIIEEWLNRQGWFTVRGIKLGVHEIDILAIKPEKGRVKCRQVEVQVSINPTTYMTPLAKDVRRRTGRSAHSAKHRSTRELKRGVREWVEKKFRSHRKECLRQSLCPGAWSKELVVHKMKYAEEEELIRGFGVEVHHLSDIVVDLLKPTKVVSKASGGDLVDLIHLQSELLGDE
jgi:tRNA U55 pseudouridine synthase TruB